MQKSVPLLCQSSGMLGGQGLVEAVRPGQRPPDGLDHIGGLFQCVDMGLVHHRFIVFGVGKGKYDLIVQESPLHCGYDLVAVVDVQIQITAAEKIVQHRRLDAGIQMHIGVLFHPHQLGGHLGQGRDVELHIRQCGDQRLALFELVGVGADQCLCPVAVGAAEIICSSWEAMALMLSEREMLSESRAASLSLTWADMDAWALASVLVLWEALRLTEELSTPDWLADSLATRLADSLVLVSVLATASADSLAEALSEARLYDWAALSEACSEAVREALADSDAADSELTRDSETLWLTASLFCAELLSTADWLSCAEVLLTSD